MKIANRAPLLLALALASCGQAANPTAASNTQAPANDVAVAQPEPGNATAPAPGSASTTDEAQAATIPAALRGRWGLVPGDCTSTRGDAKGLVTITAGEIRFYESVARPAKIAERTDRVIRGEFDFIGEGMEWTNYMTWSATGDRLTRVDSEPDSRLVYTRC